MRFALLGNHPEGLAVAQALVASGRHQLASYTGPRSGLDFLRQRGLEPFSPVPIGDPEEVLADPAIEAVVVASPLSVRPAHLRRALQSERHVLCVYPADESPDIAYEAAMIQADTGRALLPLLPDALHPGVLRLKDIIRDSGEGLGGLRLVTMQIQGPEPYLLNEPDVKPALPGWAILRALGGEIAELAAFAAGEVLAPGEPCLLSGRFERGGLLQMTLLPGAPEPHRRLTVVGHRGQAELVFPTPGSNRTCLRWQREGNEPRAEHWDDWSPWPLLVAAFEAAMEAGGRKAEVSEESAATSLIPDPYPPSPNWQDAIRCLELDDAARRSAGRRRTSVLEYQEATEETGFKGTMTLVGCGVLWGILLILVLSAWLPALRWAILPLLAVFLVLQTLRWMMPRNGSQGGRSEGRGASGRESGKRKQLQQLP
jgi:predicted dehydrogenase